MQVAQSNLGRHLRILAEDIGVRLAGSPGDRQAADYIAAEFAAAGAAVTVEEFPVGSRAVEEEHLQVRIDGSWMDFPGLLFVNTPGTDGETVEAPVVFFEAPATTGRVDYERLRGKAVVHLGCHIESRDAYRALVEAQPAFLLFVDVRYPGSEPLADAMFPAYVDAVGAVPTVNVAYTDAWRWKVEGADAARLTVHGGMRDGVSRNVIGELRGSDADEGLLFVGAHHDTQACSVGADDNGTGVAGVLECARLLAGRSRRRTIRLVSFGCEEQLSLGSAAYARRHREDLARRGQFMFNIDSYGSHLGWNDLISNGPADMETWIPTHFPNDTFRFLPEVMPYADHFPLVAAGVPSVSLIRSNCIAGRFFHHRTDDDLTRVSTEVMASLLDGVIACIDDLATCDALPFPAVIPPELKAGVDAYWQDLFGGW